MENYTIIHLPSLYISTCLQNALESHLTLNLTMMVCRAGNPRSRGDWSCRSGRRGPQARPWDHSRQGYILEPIPTAKVDRLAMMVFDLKNYKFLKPS